MCLKVIRGTNEQEIFETNTNLGEQVWLTDAQDPDHTGPCTQVWIGATPPTVEQITTVETTDVTEPGLFIPFEDMTVEELKDILRDRDLVTTGNKAALVKRLTGGE